MPRASHDRLHRAMFGASTPLPPRQRRTCYAQLCVASTMLLLAIGGLAMGWPTLGDLTPLAGAALAYALSILACWRDKGLYTRLMCIWYARQSPAVQEPCRAGACVSLSAATQPRVVLQELAQRWRDHCQPPCAVTTRTSSAHRRHWPVGAVRSARGGTDTQRDGRGRGAEW